MEDHELLTRSLHQGEEEAFTTLVQKYTDFVYSAAVRQLNNRMLAEEVVQTVFLTLSRKAHRIRGNVVLSGWLHRATRFACLEIARAESCRHQREDGFGHMNAPGRCLEESTDSWEQAAPDQPPPVAHGLIHLMQNPLPLDSREKVRNALDGLEWERFALGSADSGCSFSPPPKSCS